MLEKIKYDQRYKVIHDRSVTSYEEVGCSYLYYSRIICALNHLEALGISPTPPHGRCGGGRIDSLFGRGRGDGLHIMYVNPTQ